MKRCGRNEAGFTLIELLVVVLIIGILASIAIPQYFKVVERAKATEAVSFVMNVKNAMARYQARYGIIFADVRDLNQLDVSFPGNAPSYGMKCFTATALAECGTGGAGFNLSLQRADNRSSTPGQVNCPAPSRYGKYTLTFNSCTNVWTCSGQYCSEVQPD